MEAASQGLEQPAGLPGLHCFRNTYDTPGSAEKRLPLGPR